MSHGHSPYLAHHFDDLEQQKEASTLGMWLFLVQEIMFFGGLFMCYLLYRWKDPNAFAAGSHELVDRARRLQYRRADRLAPSPWRWESARRSRDGSRR